MYSTNYEFDRLLKIARIDDGKYFTFNREKFDRIIPLLERDGSEMNKQDAIDVMQAYCAYAEKYANYDNYIVARSVDGCVTLVARKVRKTVEIPLLDAHMLKWIKGTGVYRYWQVALMCRGLIPKLDQRKYTSVKEARTNVEFETHASFGKYAGRKWTDIVMVDAKYAMWVAYVMRAEHAAPAINALCQYLFNEAPVIDKPVPRGHLVSIGPRIKEKEAISETTASLLERFFEGDYSSFGKMNPNTIGKHIGRSRDGVGDNIKPYLRLMHEHNSKIITKNKYEKISDRLIDLFSNDLDIHFKGKKMSTRVLGKYFGVSDMSISRNLTTEQKQMIAEHNLKLKQNKKAIPAKTTAEKLKMFFQNEYHSFGKIDKSKLGRHFGVSHQTISEHIKPYLLLIHEHNLKQNKHMTTVTIKENKHTVSFKTELSVSEVEFAIKEREADAIADAIRGEYMRTPPPSSPDFCISGAPVENDPVQTYDPRAGITPNIMMEDVKPASEMTTEPMKLPQCIDYTNLLNEI